jgi:hypothetical protein
VARSPWCDDLDCNLLLWLVSSAASISLRISK